MPRTNPTLGGFSIVKTLVTRLPARYFGMAAGVAVAGMLLGSNFVNYSALDEDPVLGQKMGIIVIEVGVGMTVCGVLLSIYHAFACRQRVR